MRSAETAVQTLNGRKIFDTEIRCNWAYNQQQSAREDLSAHYHIFVGDLSAEVNDEVLQKAFSAFGSLSDARCMWDMNTGKSRGYGFLAFRKKEDAEQAIAGMNGEWLGSRAIRVNWANQKNQVSDARERRKLAAISPASLSANLVLTRSVTTQGMPGGPNGAGAASPMPQAGMGNAAPSVSTASCCHLRRRKC